MKNCLIILLCIAVLGFGCDDAFETVIPIDPPAYKPVLVLNSYANNTDSILEVFLGRNIGIFDNNLQEDMSDAKIQVFENSQQIISFANNNPTNTGYKFDLPLAAFRFQPGKTYTISAASTNFETVLSSQTMPPAVSVSNLKLVENKHTDPFGKVYDAIEFEINDPNDENYYEFGAFIEDFGFKYGIYSQLFNGRDNVFFGSDEAISYNELHLINDETYNGNNYIINLLVDTIYRNPSIGQLSLSFSHITKDKYRYVSSLIQHQNNQNNPFAEPVQVYTNIEQGLGIFSLQHVQFIPVQ